MTSGRMLGPALGALLALAVAAPARSAEPSSARPSRGDAYVLARGEHFSIGSSTVEELNAAHRRFAGNFLWIRRAGREYLARDLELLAEAFACFEGLDETKEPRRELEARRDELDAEQHAVDAEQEDLDRETDASEDDVELEDASGREDAVRDLETRRREIEKRQQDLEAKERELETAESRIDRREEELERAAEASLWRLVDRAIADGAARRVD